jgi:hypothetical protein
MEALIVDIELIQINESRKMRNIGFNKICNKNNQAGYLTIFYSTEGRVSMSYGLNRFQRP